jgi:protein involved in polysaccharide export with SLBB domain
MVGRQVMAVVVLGALAVGCARSRTVPQSSAPAASTGLTDESDRTRLAALVAERSQRRPSGGYHIGPDDLLEIRIPDLIDVAPATPLSARTPEGGVPAVTGAPTFAQGVRVSGSGDVTLPLLGQVRADGLTPAELEHEIARQLVARGILRAPQVSVSVVEYRSRVVAVVGAVERPGVFPVTRPGATVSDLIWAAGGPSKDAGRVVHLMPGAGDGDGDHDRRGVGQHPGEPIRVDLDTLLHPSNDGLAAATLPVFPGDVISIAPAGNVTVQGWVDKPGSYPVTRGLSLAGAVAAAGGPQFAADVHHATVRRAGDNQPVTYDLDAIGAGRAPDVVVTDGDVVRVPASTLRVVPWGLWTAARDLFRLGGDVLLF